MKQKGFTCGCFDLLHAGHILMLKEAKEVCDYLIVGLQVDPTLDRPNKNKPIKLCEKRTCLGKQGVICRQVVIKRTHSIVREHIL